MRKMRSCRAALIALALAAASVAVAPAASAQVVVNVPASIPADCSSDTTAALQAVIDGAPDGAKVQFPASGCYEVDGTLNVTDRTGLYLALNYSTLKMVVTASNVPKAHHDMVAITGSTGVTVHNGTLQATNTAGGFDVNYEWWGLVHIMGGSNITVDHVTGLNSWGDFVNIGADLRSGATQMNPDTILVDSDTDNVVGRNHVSVTDGDNITVSNSSFKSNGYQVWDIELDGSAWHARNINFLNNTVSGPVHGALLDNGSIGHDIGPVTVSGNVMNAAQKSCLPLINVVDTAPVQTNYTVDNNSFKTIYTVLAVDGVDGFEAVGNTVTSWGSGCQSPVKAISGTSTTVNIQNNDFTGTTILGGANMSGTFCNNKVTGTGFVKPTTC